MSKRLEGKVAVVTGGSTGIGLGTAKRLAAEGAHVYITGRRQSELDAAVKEIGPAATAVQGDVANLNDLDRLYSQVKQEKGHIDVLFANAGFGEFAKFGEISEDHFDRLFDTNVKGLLFSVQKALPLLAEGSSVILNASIVSIKGMANFSVYSATKAAVRSFARTWTTDLKDRKIRVNVVSPGPILTPAIDGLVKEGKNDFKRQLEESVPLGYIGDPEDIAAAVAFLASEESRFVAGVELFVDGGLAQV